MFAALAWLAMSIQSIVNFKCAWEEAPPSPKRVRKGEPADAAGLRVQKSLKLEHDGTVSRAENAHGAWRAAGRSNELIAYTIIKRFFRSIRFLDLILSKLDFLEYLFGNPLLTILQTCYLCATQNVLGICDAFRLHHETCKTIQHLQGKASPVANDPAEIESSKNIKKQTIVWKKINNFSKIPLFLALNSSKFHHIFSSNDGNPLYNKQ